MVKLSSPENHNTVQVARDGMLMVCLCDEDSENLIVGPLLAGGEICQPHQALKLASLVKIGVPLLLHVKDSNGEIWPMTEGMFNHE